MEPKSSLIRLSTALEVGNEISKDREGIKSVLLESKTFRQANCSKAADKIIG
jgi:hypothetical protein